jgi:hypothetical protein
MGDEHGKKDLVSRYFCEEPSAAAGCPCVRLAARADEGNADGSGATSGRRLSRRHGSVPERRESERILKKAGGLNPGWHGGVLLHEPRIGRGSIREEMT